MYSTNDKPCEDICFDEAHINKVVAEILKNFEPYFINFVETSAGSTISLEQFKELQKKFGSSSSIQKSSVDYTKSLKDIFQKSIDSFEKDRDKYIELLDEDNLSEYQYDPTQFKSQALHNECPIIRGTLMNTKAKELDRYRKDFKRADPNNLLQVVMNLSDFGHSYQKNYYNPDNYLKITSFKDLNMELLDTDDYTYYGVIGGGIKTLMLYKLDPEVFSYRSKSAIWSLYYLTNKKVIDCRQDSEFLIIDVKKVITKQNYFYPYQLFAKYAFEVFKLLNNKAKELNVYLNPQYRYVIVDAFFEHIAKIHETEISELSHELKEDGYGYGTMGF